MEKSKSVRLDPIFVIGYMRSGTTMLRLMINKHPDLFVPRESAYFQRLPMKYPDRMHQVQDIDKLVKSVPIGSYGRLLDKEYFRKLLQENLPAGNNVLLACLYQAYAVSLGNNDVRWGDKKPQHWQFVYCLREWYPDAQFIHIVRDPRDVIASIEDYTRNKNVKLTNQQYIFNGQLLPSHIVLAWHWQYEFKTMSEQAQILGDQRYLMIKYEELVAEPSYHAERICHFLNCKTEFIDEMLKFREDAKNKKIRDDSSDSISPHNLETTKEVNQQRIGRYKATLTEQQIGDIEFICGDIIKEMGYEEISTNISVARRAYINSLCNLLLLAWKGLRATRRIRGSL
jgi:hypothetical protein